MAHLQYMPGDPRLVDQLVYELKSKGIFDQFRKDCISDVDTRPAYQNLRQRVESSVSTFLSRQTWRSDLNKNQMREKLRKHILDGNYLDQGVERIVDQVVNPKVASVFMPQVEDLVYNYLGIPRKKPKADVEKTDLLPTDLEAVSPGSVKSNIDIDFENVEDMEIDSEGKQDTNEIVVDADAPKDNLIEVFFDSASVDNSMIPLPQEEIKPETIPAPDDSPKQAKLAIENIKLPGESNKTDILIDIELPTEPKMTDIPLPDEILPMNLPDEYNIFKPIALNSEDSNTSSGSSIRRNMSPLTPVRNFDDENSCDAQQAFENNSDQNNKELSNFKFNIETNSTNISDDKKETELSYQFNNQVNINTFNTPMYDDSSNSHNLQIDYESDANTNVSKPEVKEVENTEDSKKERKDDKKNHKSSHRSRDSSRHSSSKDKHSSRDNSKHDKKSSKDEKDKSKSRDKEKSKDSDKKNSRHRSSHKSSSSSKDKHRSSSSSHKSNKSSDERKSSRDSTNKDSPNKDRSSDKDKHSNDRKSSSHRDKDRKSSKKDDKDKKKKDTDDHYSSSGRGNHNRRSTDRDSNDGSSSSKGSHSQNNSKSSESKKESKNTGKSDNTSTTSSESTSPCDKEHTVNKVIQSRPVVRVDHLETPITNPSRLPFVPDITLKKPKFANNFEEAKKMMKMRKFLAEEQKRMNQEAALLLEFQANVRPSLSQVYSSIPGPELEFACVTQTEPTKTDKGTKNDDKLKENDAVKLEVTETKASDEEIKTEDSNTAFVVDLVIDEHIERKQVTKDIINDIIGVPINDGQYEQNYDVKSDCLIETETSEIPKVSIENIEIEPDNNSNEDSQLFLHLVGEVSMPYKQEIDKSSEERNKPFSHIVDDISVTHKDKEISIEESLAEIVNQNMATEYDIPTAETLSETEVSEILDPQSTGKESNSQEFKENELQFFAEHEKYSAELERHKFNHFLKEYIAKTHINNKIYLLNCDTYEENIVKEIATNFGDFEIVNYYKNGHLIPSKNIVKDVPLSAEISLPVDNNLDTKIQWNQDYSPLFSPVKSECSFDLSSDYDAKLDEIVNKKSRQEVMEIILGGMIDESPSKMPTIDYYTEDDLTVIEEDSSVLKRRIDTDVNKLVLTQNKIRKMSDSEQISSTTEETEASNNNKVQSAPRSKYLGRAKRVGLSKPKKCSLPNSPSSDKSVENYSQNITTPPNGKLKPVHRNKVQRYDTSDLYKPKLHYLSRRNIS